MKRKTIDSEFLIISYLIKQNENLKNKYLDPSILVNYTVFGSKISKSLVFIQLFRCKKSHEHKARKLLLHLYILNPHKNTDL